MLSFICELAFSAYLQPISSINAPISEKLQGAVSNEKVSNAVDKLFEAEDVVRSSDNGKTEYLRRWPEKTIREAGRGAFVEREWKCTAAEKLEEVISKKIGKAPDKITVPVTLSRSSPLVEDVYTLDERIGIIDKPKEPSRVKNILNQKD